MAKKASSKKSSGKKVTRKRRRLNIDKARKKQRELEDRGGNEFHEIKEGWNFFLLLPPWSDDVDEIWKEVQQHQRLVCPRSTVGKPCIMCDEINKRMKRGDTEFADDNKLRSRAFFNAIRKEHIKEKSVENVKVLALPPTVFEAILEHITDEEMDISDPKAAVIVGIKRKGKGMRTRYPKVKFSDPVNVSKFITDEILENLWDLDALRYVQPASVKELRKAIRGAADDEEDDSSFGDEDLSGDEDELGEDDLGEEDGEGEEGEEGGEEEDELLSEPDDDSEEGGEDEGEDEGEEDGEDDLDDLMSELEDGEGEEEEEEKPRVRKADKKAGRKKAGAKGTKKKVRKVRR